MNKELVHNIKKSFILEYSSDPLMVFSPGRINLIGEHTDYNNGFVFPAAINKGIVTAVNTTNNSFCSVKSLDLNESFQFTYNDIKPLKNGKWKNYVLGVIYEILKSGKHLQHFNMAFGGDIPIGAGLSSSAALENSIVFGLNELFDLRLSKKEMVLISQKAEHHFVNVNCGIMDQYISMFGENNAAVLLDCESLEAKPFEIDLSNHQFLLINTNVKHRLAENSYNNRRMTCEKVAGMLGKKSLRHVTKGDLNTIKNKLSKSIYQKALFVIQENKRVLEAAQAIENNDPEFLGSLIYASHSGLQHQYKVSCEELDFLVQLTKRDPNVIGARMMGGGFGGCTINLVKRSAIDTFSEYIQKQYKIKFNGDCNIYNVHLYKGTHIINI